MCPACEDKVLHTDTEWVIFHPQAGYGYTKEQGWTGPLSKSAATSFRTALPSSLIHTS